MTARPSSRRRLRALLAGTALVATGVALGPAAPVAAQDPGWTVRIDDLPAVLTQRPVVVAGTARTLVGPARTARVRLVPQGALARACPDPVVAEVPVGRDGRFRADDLRPPCNGPYEAQVVATAPSLVGGTVTSGAPRREPFALADPGPAPAAPRVSAAGTAVAIRWDAVADPDVVGWTVVRDDGATTDLGRDATSLTETVAPGPYHYRLVLRRWGAGGPDGPAEQRTASPASPVGSVDVVRSDAGPAPVPEVPGGGAGPSAGGGAAPPVRRGSGGSPPPSRRAPRSTPTTVGADGYEGELPYGAPDEAFLPQEDRPADEESAAGTSPSARVVETSEEAAPGLVAPFALALLLATVAAHITAYLRRSARAARPT